MPKTVAVIDGNSLMHRAYHAVPPTMTAPDGISNNAAFGFLSMLLKFIEMEQPMPWSARLIRAVPSSVWRRSSSTRRNALLWMKS